MKGPGRPGGLNVGYVFLLVVATEPWDGLLLEAGSSCSQ